jgi:hypothetical protein
MDSVKFYEEFSTFVILLVEAKKYEIFAMLHISW